MANPDNIDIRPGVPRLNIRWENGSYSMDHILRRFPLPNVVQCDSVISDVSREHSNFDFLQPMLIYKKRLCMKVIAHSLDLNRTTKTANELGNQLLVPEDYKGWFAVLDIKKVNGPVPHYGQVELLSQSDCDTFLIGGKENVDAVQKMKGMEHPVPRLLYPGDVLKMGNTYVAKTTERRFGRSVVKESKFLLCIDQHDRDVLLPFGSTGKFYVIKNKTKRPPIRIMQIKEIINNVRLPCVVKLLFGLEPTSPCFFSGFLVLKHSFEEFSVVASSIVNLRNILLEIPSDIPLKFKVAAEGNNLEDNVGFRNAFRLCEEKADRYMRNIKVSQGISSADDIPESEAPPPPRDDYPGQFRTPEAPACQQSIPLNYHDGPSQTQRLNSQFQLPSHRAYRGKDQLQRSPGTQRGEESPPQVFQPPSPGKYGEHPSPTTERPGHGPSPGPLSLPPKSRKSSIENPAPSPPPQSAKPDVLERVVTFQSAPPLMVPPSQSTPQPQSSHFRPEAPPSMVPPSTSAIQTKVANLLNQHIGQSQLPISPSGMVAKSPTKRPPPDTPPKPVKNLSRQKPLRISIDNNYLTVPVYLTPQHIDSASASAEDETVSDKRSFWKNLDQATKEASKKVAIPKQNPKNAATTDSQQKAIGGRKQRTTVYENIEDLKVFQQQVRQPSFETSNDDAASDDVTYEFPSFQRDDVIYENPDFATTDSGQGLTYEEVELIRPRTEQRSERPRIDSGINMGEEEENCVSEVARMTGPEVCGRLAAAGVKSDTVKMFRENKVDGHMLSSLNEDTLKSAFPKLTNIEILKIGLLMKGLKNI